MKKPFYKTTLFTIAILFSAIFILILVTVSWWITSKKIVSLSNNSEGIKISIITDIDHCARRNVVASTPLENFVTFAEQKESDLIISLRDNISHRLGDCSKTAETDLPFVLNILKSFSRDAHFVLGDHDIASSVKSYNFWMQMSQNEKNYYSFDQGDLHIIILDTVLGGREMAASCEENPTCATDLTAERALRASLKNTTLSEQERSALWLQFSQAKEARERYEKDAKLSRDSTKRDVGSITEEQLIWLKNDLKHTAKKDILIFSDHPLFPFVSERKSYNIVNQEKLENILLEQKRKKHLTINAISGEAHVWHKESREGINYYIINEFKADNASWAHLEWTNSGMNVFKVIDGKITERLQSSLTISLP